MWKKNLVAGFHGRTASFKAQGSPLLRSGGSRPISTATLEPVQEQDTNTHQPASTVAPITTNSEKQHMSSPTTSGKASPTIPVIPKNELVVGNSDIESNNSQGMRSIREYLLEELDMTQAAPPLSAYCFMTGFIDAVCFTAVYVWCAFQTGNTVQLSLAVARLFNGSHDYAFQLADQQALCSLLSFIFGASIGRIGDKIGCKTRGWMALGTFFQALFTMIGAICVWKSHEGAIASSRGAPAWVNVLSFVTIGAISASVGLQGIMAKRLNTQFTTTVVLTTTWCELLTEPELLNFRRLVKSRDHKAMAIIFLFLGGFTGRAVLDRIGDAGTLGVGTGVRFLISIWWLLAPAKNAKK